jgi:diadenosine tetraphosphate (Ap4A) HIT family hydrolase
VGQYTEELLMQLRTQILGSDPTVVGFNIGANCGGAAGQTIEHAHIHLIPRRLGDTPAPKGGVRTVIPEKMVY